MPINVTSAVDTALRAAIAKNTNPNELAKQKATQAYWAEAWSKEQTGKGPYKTFMNNVNEYKKTMSDEEAIKRAREDWKSTIESGIKRKMAEQGGNINSIDSFIKRAKELNLANMSDDVNNFAHDQKRIKDTIAGFKDYMAKGGN